MKNSNVFISFLALLMSILPPSPGNCNEAAGDEVKNREIKNVVLIVIDTLRADSLPFYGYPQNTSPYLAKLAAKGLVMENNFSTSSWTAPGTASILTGLYPFQHGVMMGRSATRRLQKKDPAARLNRIPDAVTTIAEMLQAEGYQAFGVADNGNIREDAGFAQGFSKFRTFTNEGAQKITDTLSEWEKEIKAANKSFVYMQFMDPHHPYLKREPWYQTPEKRGAVDKLKASYNSEIRFVDEHFEALSKKFDWENNALVILSSDHGEEFREHKGLGHGKSLFSEVVRVPFMAYAPGASFAGKRIQKPSSNIDILATIADILNIKTDFYQQGMSVLALENAQEPRAIYTHLWKKVDSGEEVYMYGILEDSMRYVFQSAPKKHQGLYDLQLDPAELKNLFAEQKEKARALEEKYLAFEASAKKFDPAWADTDLSREAISE